MTGPFAGKGVMIIMKKNKSDHRGRLSGLRRGVGGYDSALLAASSFVNSSCSNASAADIRALLSSSNMRISKSRTAGSSFERRTSIPRAESRLLR
jgi:hypothetical protein